MYALCMIYSVLAVVIIMFAYGIQGRYDDGPDLRLGVVYACGGLIISAFLIVIIIIAWMLVRFCCLCFKFKSKELTQGDQSRSTDLPVVNWKGYQLPETVSKMIKGKWGNFSCGWLEPVSAFWLGSDEILCIFNANLKNSFKLEKYGRPFCVACSRSGNHLISVHAHTVVVEWKLSEPSKEPVKINCSSFSPLCSCRNYFGCYDGKLMEYHRQKGEKEAGNDYR